MIKNKKVLIASLLIASLLEAKTLLNGVSVLVNNEPITLYEIHKLSKQNNIPLKQALNMLIQKRLEDSQVKRLGIEASTYEIDQEIDNISKKNGVSEFELLAMVESRGLDEEDYRHEIAQGIKTKKLYSRIFQSDSSKPNEQEINAFYEANKDRFTKANDFHVTVYHAQTQIALKQVIAAPMSVVAGVRVKQDILNSSNLDKRSLYFLNQTPKGSFTPIMKANDGFVTFLVGDKVNSTLMNKEEALPLVQNMLASQKQKIAVKNYFDKLKSSANIEVLRRP